MTPKASKKAQNIRRKSKIYFSIDDESFPYKGVKGKGEAIILEDPKKIMSLGKFEIPRHAQSSFSKDAE